LFASAAARNLRQTVRSSNTLAWRQSGSRTKIYPRRNSFGPGEDHEMIGAHQFATKMRAAKQRQRHADSMIVSSSPSQECWSRRV
jgi:hypothetical protein